MLSRTSKRGLSSLAAALKNNALIDIHPEVAEALHARKPVVALESTIITHGMPYPVNLETARSVERNVRTSGSIPPTIGLIEGRIKVGLEQYELERLAECRNEPVKLSRRDIGAAIVVQEGWRDHL
jgi:pseudouridine-5'-phosphate glycosidase/pseudouridine kinase